MAAWTLLNGVHNMKYSEEASKFYEVPLNLSTWGSLRLGSVSRGLLSSINLLVPSSSLYHL